MKRAARNEKTAKLAAGVTGDDQAAFARRLRILIERSGSVLGLAKSADLENSTIHLWLRGSEPSREKLVKLATAAGVSIEWLAAGRGPMAADLLPEGYALVRHYKGDGEVEYQGVDYLALKKDWIRSLPGSPIGAALFLTEADGDAMAPYIESGDLILINTSDRDLRDGVWAIISSSGIRSLLIRRIRAEGRGKFRLLCDNRDFESTPGQTVRGQELRIIGRVIWRARTIP